jgi:hypothetical protein
MTDYQYQCAFCASCCDDGPGLTRQDDGTILCRKCVGYREGFAQAKLVLEPHCQHRPGCPAASDTVPVDGETGWIYVRDQACTCGLTEKLGAIRK